MPANQFASPAQWAVVPAIRPWDGDRRTDRTPYALTGSMSLGAMGVAQFAARQLRARGIACYVELI